MYLNFIVLNLIVSLDQENKWNQVKLENNFKKKKKLS